jgi:hypothetical protein
MPRLLTPEQELRHPFNRRAVPSRVCQDRSGEACLLPLPSFEPQTVQPVPSHYTLYVILTRVYYYTQAYSHCSSFSVYHLPVSLPQPTSCPVCSVVILASTDCGQHRQSAVTRSQSVVHSVHLPCREPVATVPDPAWETELSE